MDDAGLGYGVGDAAAAGDDSRPRGDVDDAAPALGLHQRRDCLDAVERAGEIGGEDVIPEFVRQAIEVGIGNRLVEGGVVHQDLDPAEFGPGLLHHPRHVGRVGDVGPDGHCTHAELGDLFGHAFRLGLRRGVIHHHVDALERQRPADALSQSPAAAGNDSRTTFEVHSGVHAG